MLTDQIEATFKRDQGKLIIRHVEGRDARGNTIITTRIIKSHDWPTREEWARQTRTWTRYIDDDDPVHVSRKVSDYLSPHEIAALIANLKARRSSLGKEGREIRKQHPERFGRKRGGPISLFDVDVDDHSYTRQQIFQAIKLLKDDRIPIYGDDGGYLPELRELKKRREAAYEAEESIDALPDSEWLVQVVTRGVR